MKMTSPPVAGRAGAGGDHADDVRDALDRACIRPHSSAPYVVKMLRYKHSFIKALTRTLFRLM